MTFVPTDSILGLQPIAVTSTVQNHPLGLIINAYDPTLGGAEFIYLKGVASTLVGSIVIYDPVNATTTLATNTAKQGNPAAVAMSANVASQFGWYQIAGAAVIKKTAVAVVPASKIAISGTAGRVLSGSTAGAAVFNAKTVNAATVASATSTITTLIQRPFLEPLAT